jgi:NAD-dependent DNA ligase
MLTNQLQNAITTRDIIEISKILEICDYIHSSGLSIKNYNISDLPPDYLYEQALSLTKIHGNDIAHGLIPVKVSRDRDEYIEELWMGSVVKCIEEVNNPMCMPKFDGVSCGVTLVKKNGLFVTEIAVTRGVSRGIDHDRSNITTKFNYLSSNLINELNEMDYVFPSLNLDMKDIYKISLRGEIVLKERGEERAWAAIVAGKINGGLEIFMEAKDTLEFIPFEITRINETLVPLQSEVIELFMITDLFPSLHEMQLRSEEDFPNILEYYKSSILNPIDGVVYCSKSWKYPMFTSETKATKYGKYAWKPTSEMNTILRNIACTVARDGKFNWIAGFDPRISNGKQYRQAKMTTKTLYDLEGIGIGHTINVKLIGEITPYVCSYNIDESIKPWKFPELCPYCKSPSRLESRKQTVIYTCTNKECREMELQKLINFVRILKIPKISDGKLRPLPNYTLSEFWSCYMNSTSPVTFFSSVDVATFLVAVGYLTKTRVEKELIRLQISPLLNTVEALPKLLEIKTEDLFIIKMISDLSVMI